MKLNNIKNKFDGREIQPSDDAWDRLSQKLDAQEKKSKKPVIYWLGAIAAVLILAVLLFPIWSSESNVEEMNSSIVIEETNEKTIEPAINNEEIKPINEEESIAIEVSEQEPELSPLKETSRKAVEKRARVTKTENTGIATTDKVLEERKLISDPIVKEAMASNEVTNQPVDINLSEADRLLNKALQNLTVKNATATSTIDPNKLLRETEWDLEDKKRNRLENTLLDGLGRLKREAVALIDRNQ